jgi:hypothetical protein
MNKLQSQDNSKAHGKEVDKDDDLVNFVEKGQYMLQKSDER